MDTLNLGQIITEDQKRDATHIAVAPVMAHERLCPGDHVGLNGAGEATEGAPHIGVVDPFLKCKSVKAGERFWLFLYPGTITGLRHEWAHPSFSAIEKKTVEINSSEAWLRSYACRLNPYDEDPEKAYQRLLDGIRDKDIFANGSDLHGLYELDDADELRIHAEKVLGIPINFNDESFSFSCSC